MNAARRSYRPLDRRVLLAAVVLSAMVAAVIGAAIATELAPNGSGGGEVQSTTNGKPSGGIAVGTLAQQNEASVVTIVTGPVTTASLLASSSVVSNGVVVGADGLILTSEQAVQGATELRISTADGHTYNATIAATDTLHGEVLLRAANATNLQPVTIAADPPSPGDVAVLVARSPLAGVEVGVGTIRGDGSVTDPTASDIADISADPSYDGAPVFTGSGQLMGVAATGTTAAAAVTVLSGRAAQALITAAASDSAPVSFGAGYALIDAGVASEVGLQPGALITSLVSGGPAALAGLRIGDVVTEVNGVAVTNSDPFEPASFDLQAGSTVTLSVWRNGATATLALTLAAH